MGFPRLGCLLVVVLAVLVGAVFASETNAASPNNLGQQIERITGAASRIVWVQDIGDGTDNLGFGDQLRLMALDSREGGGARVLLDMRRSMAKPMFTASGEWVIFSDRTAGRVYALDWSGEQLIDLGPGFGLATWKDPSTGVEWLYLARDPWAERLVLPAHHSLWRYPLIPRGQHSPRAYSDEIAALVELVWDQSPVSEDSFQISADGRYASTAFPWPHMGVLDLETGRWNQLGRGCWGAMSPDNEYLFWIFDGPHRNVHMFRAEGDERWILNVNNGPGIDGYEVYHPRWSNHPDVITVTGPYKRGEGAIRILAGGPEVKVYVGRLNEARTEVIDWVIVTDDTHADFYPDVWVEQSDMSSPAPTLRTRGEAVASSWPVSFEGLRYVWQSAGGLSEIFDPMTRSQRFFRPEPNHHARFDRFKGMLLEGGFFRDPSAGDLITGQGPLERLSIELVATSTGTDRAGDGWVFAVEVEGEPRIVLSEVDGEWRFRSDRQELVVGPVEADLPTHLALTYGEDGLQLLVNGRSSAAVSEPFHVTLDWEKAVFLFGADARGDRDWWGSLDHFAVYGRVLGASEIRANAVLARSAREALEIPAHVQVRARVTQASGIPSPDDIAPYRRALVVNEYELLEVLTGDFAEDRFLAAHWVILDATLLEEAERPKGSEHVLLLEPFDQRPELEGERVAQETDNFLLEVYFDSNL